MKSLGEIYSDSFEGKNKWYHVVWFFVAMSVMFIYLLPGGLYRYITGQKTEADIEAERFKNGE